jgi:hypothetical protein
MVGVASSACAFGIKKSIRLTVWLLSERGRTESTAATIGALKLVPLNL